jgi:type II secretory pathway predicted ATPase ExeA
MIEAYYGLKKPPFTKEIRSENMMETYDTREALARLSHIRQHRGLFCLTGEPGSGKTSVLRKFVDTLNPQTFHHCYTPHTTVSRTDFYRQLNTLLNLPPRMRKSDLFDQIQRAVQDLYGRQGKIPTFIIDEAQLMDHETLQEITLITNFEMDSKMPFLFVLIGQPEFREKLKRRIHEPLSQRMPIRYHMVGLTLEETRRYCLHHLKLVGRGDPLFEESSFEVIQQAAQGLPRKINHLCLAAMTAAMVKKSQVVTAEHVIQAAGGA